MFTTKHNEVYDIINKYRDIKKEKFDYTCSQNPQDDKNYINLTCREGKFLKYILKIDLKIRNEIKKRSKTDKSAKILRLLEFINEFRLINNDIINKDYIKNILNLFEVNTSKQQGGMDQELIGLVGLGIGGIVLGFAKTAGYTNKEIGEKTTYAFDSLSNAYDSLSKITSPIIQATSVKQALSNPTSVKQALSNPTSVKQALSNPTSVKQALSNPTSVKQALSNPTSVKQASSNPTSVKQASSNPTSVKPALSNPTSVKQASSNPTSVKQASSNPTSVKQALSNPTSVKPTSVKPTSIKPASSKPASSKPTSVKPASSNPPSVISLLFNIIQKFTDPSSPKSQKGGNDFIKEIQILVKSLREKFDKENINVKNICINGKIIKSQHIVVKCTNKDYNNNVKILKKFFKHLEKNEEYVEKYISQLIDFIKDDKPVNEIKITTKIENLSPSEINNDD
jgi:hypothetical protein